LALACAANIGSAATLVGNPQNMLIGQTLNLSFGGYVAEAVVPVAEDRDDPNRPLNIWQTGKGLTVAAALLADFLFVPWPR
jgi:hypothetical protein